MSDQPKPTTGEWTADYVASFIRESYESPGHESLQSIADAHNAALAAEKEKAGKALDSPTTTGEWSYDPYEAIEELKAALAAEREKVNVLEYAIGCLRVSEKTLVKALEEISNGNEASADSLRRYAANELARLNQNTGLDWIGRGDQ